MTNVPDGWRLVPVEPTAEMIRALDDVHCASYLWPVRAYKAMIDAAPAPSATLQPDHDHARHVRTALRLDAGARECGEA